MSCTSCDGIGYKFVYPKNWKEYGLGSVVFRCTCSSGRAKPSTGIPLWRDELLSRYQLDAHKLPENGPEEEVEPEALPVDEKPSVRRLSENDRVFIQEIRLTKEWGHPRLKELIAIFGADHVKSVMMGRV